MGMKPHKGKIKGWSKLKVAGAEGLGYLIVGQFVDHPEFAHMSGHTSWVVKHEGAEIETRNSRYTLEGDEITS